MYHKYIYNYDWLKPKPIIFINGLEYIKQVKVVKFYFKVWGQNIGKNCLAE